MSTRARFDRQLPAVLEDLYLGPTPTYRDEVMATAVRTRQRPSWTFPGRWLPMVDVARQPVIAPRLPLRAVGLGLLLIALILAALVAVAIGSRPNLPAPFGPAGNGLIAYSRAGDIFVVDRLSGQPTALVTGPDLDLQPLWSRDGTKLAFLRRATTAENSGGVSLYVARADGRGLTLVTPTALEYIASFSFSPDGRELLISARVGGVSRILIAAADGGWIHQLDIAKPATNASWRPPLGEEIMFTDDGDTSDGFGGLYVVGIRGGAIRTIYEPTAPLSFRAFPAWSPDGSRIAYSEWTEAPTLTVRTHVVNADGTGDRVLPIPAGAVWESGWTWSNDGTRLLSIRGYGGYYELSRAVARPVDGSGTGIEIEYPGVINGECCSVWEWAPDDSSILGTPTDATGVFLPQVMVDPRAGTATDVPWTTTSSPAWQRIARTE
jgi:dipeptidyl aminopeptidase/acylaminoacyl peptidase